MPEQEKNARPTPTLRLIRTVLNASPVGMVVCDAGGAILHANPAAERLFGRNRSETEIRSLLSKAVHLLLTDVVMPEMNGRELYDRAFRRYPRLKVLFMSGYTDNVIAHRGVIDEGVHFIQKPFSVRILAAKVREVLDGGGET